MSDKFKNPRAFACAAGDEFLQEGMSLRDYFAAKAMQGIVSDSEYGRGLDNYIESVSELSYKIADYILEQRNK